MTISTRITIRTLFLLLLPALVTACVSGPPQPVVDYRSDYNFSPVKKIAFHRDSGMVSGDNPMQLSDMERDRINRALSGALGNRGYQLVADEGDADLLISWHLVTQHQTDVRQSPGFGYGYGYGYRYGHAAYGYGAFNPYACDYYGFGGLRSEVYSTNYTKGKFIVDMIDPSMDKSVWRGITESRLKKKPELDQTRYNEAAAAMLASFPPS